MSEPQYDDQGASAQDVPEVDSPEHRGAEEQGPGDGAHLDAHRDDRQDAEPDLSAAAPTRAEHTGNPVVDSVLDSLEELDRLPPAEHVTVFEAAHERLRGALSDAGEPPAES